MKIVYKIVFTFLLVFSSNLIQSQVTDSLKGKAVGSFKKLDQTNRWVNSFSNLEMVELPVGIRKTVSNTTYSIGVTKATFTPDYTILQVFCKIDIPQTTADGRPIQLFFGSDNIKLSHDGGIVGDAKLVLLGDVDIPFNDKKWQLSLYGGFDMQTGNISDKTFVTIDCDGFKDMKLTGAVEFSRQLILPIEANGTVNENKTTIARTQSNGRVKQVPYRVKGDFVFQASNWNDILVNVSLQPFVLKDKRNGTNYDGNFQFLVNNAVFDFSDLNNHPAVQFPSYYTENSLLQPNPNTWRGVYIETFNIALPKEFKTKESQAQNTRINIGASHLIIDKFGVSGKFYATNVFPLDRGITSNEKSWAISLDYIDISIEANTFVKANLRGEILLPISKYKAPEPTPSTNSGATVVNSATQPVVAPPQTNRAGLLYDGFISPNEQRLIVVTKNAISFDIWKAKAILEPNSSIELKLVNGTFLPKANLNGSISIESNNSTTDASTTIQGNKTVDFKGIVFQNLQLQTVSPMISVQSMNYSGNVVKFANFPVSISNIGIIIQNNTARIDFDLGLNLMDSASFAATARLGIKGKLYEEDFKQKWKYDGLDLSAIKIDAEFSGMTLKGNLNLLENDPIYGDGFNADLSIKIKDQITVSAKAIFGRSTFRYWYFDAAANWSVPAAPFMISGFGGGAYYKMKRNPNLDRTVFSPSGLSYTPDENVGLGLKAMINFIVGSDKACNGEAGFELEFNSSGGINNLAIFGKAAIQAKIPGAENIGNLMNKVASDITSKTSFLGVSATPTSGSFAEKFLPKAQAIIPTPTAELSDIAAKMALEFDFQNNSIHGTLDVLINTPGNFLSGIGPEGRAGWAVFHKDPQHWYLYVGTPSDRIGVRIGVAGISIQTGSYLMVGNQLPGSPPPPDIVAQILGVDASSLNYMRNENDLANAGGFAFGSSIDFSTGDLSFLIFYANFQAGIGFDIMMKDYGEARCSNTGQQVGINGWYANGQAYAYLQGELGVRVKLLFVNLKIPIISAGAAVLLQAKLPNPFWLRGYVGGQMNILGGLIKGRFRFKLTIGEECIFENGSPLGGLKMITDLKPATNSTNIDVFAVPQATFSMKVNQAIVIPEDDGDVTYKIILDTFKVYDNTTEIPGIIQWSSMNDRADFVSTDILPPNKLLKVKVEVSFQKMVNGVFQTIYVNGQVAKEIEERTFTTGMAPSYIPLTNIQYSYPVVDQKYFYENEFDKGYIQLKRGQDYLFDISNWQTKVKLEPIVGGNQLSALFDYNTASNELSYDLPNINQNTEYLLAISSSPLNSSGQSNTASNTTTTSVVNDGTANGNNINVTQNNAQSVSQDGAVQRLTYNFKTSLYSTFTNKMNSITTQNYNYWSLFPDVIYLANTINSQEAFDIQELLGTIYSDNKALIDTRSMLNSTYLQTDIFPFIYNPYPVGNQYLINNRDTTELGLVPVRAMPINPTYIANAENNVNLNWNKNNFPYKYNLPLIYKQDWMNIRNQVMNDYVSGLLTTNSLAYKFLNNEYTFMRFGFYDVSVKYVLPGNKKETECIYKFKNVNSFR